MNNSQLGIFDVPERSGIYLFYLPKWKVGYIGRSNNLRRRYHQHIFLGSHKREITNYSKKYDDLEYIILEYTDGYKAKDQRSIESHWIEHFKRKGMKLLNITDPNLEFDHDDAKPLLVYDKNTLNFVGEFKSSVEASKALRVNSNNISTAIRERLTKKGTVYSLKNYFFFYKEEFTENSLLEKKIRYTNALINKRTAQSNSGKLRGKKITQHSIEGNFIKIWDSLMDVERTGITTNQNICECLKGRQKTSGGFIWKYAEQEITEND